MEPSTAEEIEDAISEFKEAGFDGCIGSADATHVIMEKCTARLKNQHLGDKMPHTARAFEITVNHRRRILSTTVGFYQQLVERQDHGFINRIHRRLLYENDKYKLFQTNRKQNNDAVGENDEKGKNDETSELFSMKVAWILVDGGYLRWSCIILPYKQYARIQEQRRSK